MSDDLLNQHAAISEIQQAEEIVVDQHKAINEFLTQFLPESIELYNMTNSVDYDQDGEFNSICHVILFSFYEIYFCLMFNLNSTNATFNLKILGFFLLSLSVSVRIRAAYSKRGEEIFAQLADLATTCQNLMADFRGKLANEEMLSHNVHPGKR